MSDDDDNTRGSSVPMSICLEVGKLITNRLPLNVPHSWVIGGLLSTLYVQAQLLYMSREDMIASLNSVFDTLEVSAKEADDAAEAIADEFAGKDEKDVN